MPVLVYSLLRILLILVAGAGLYLAGMRGWLLVVVAVLVGAGLSYVLLDNQRRASAEWLAARGRGRTRVEDRLASDADEEDALLDDEAAPTQTGATAAEAETGAPDGEQRSDGQDHQETEPDDQL
ncbi:DUF4229 domain-containing protein [Ruania albidiflava]|uniref:DUF4229 domain-containing protein n=1 Tax=Ruania albidiflava TaxID=366586 RepID=UPI0003B610E9|nr:DUF4229 domain-containing protein [Ruania albidiflava]